MLPPPLEAAASSSGLSSATKTVVDPVFRELF